MFTRRNDVSNIKSKEITENEVMILAWPAKLLFIIMGKCPFALAKKDNKLKLDYSYPMVIFSFLSKLGLIAVVTWVMTVYPWSSNSISDKAQKINSMIWFLGSTLISASNCFTLRRQLQAYQDIFNLQYEIITELNDKEK